MLPGGNRFFRGQHGLRAKARGVFARELRLAQGFRRGVQAQAEDVAEYAGAGHKNGDKQKEETARQMTPRLAPYGARAANVPGSLPQERRFCRAECKVCFVSLTRGRCARLRQCVAALNGAREKAETLWWHRSSMVQ